MAKKWSEVIQNPDFQALDPTAQERVRTDYFKQIVLPQVDASQIPQVQADFDADTKGTIGQTQSQSAQNLVQPVQPQTTPVAQSATPVQSAGGFMEHLQQLQATDDAQGMTAAKKAVGLARAVGQGATFGYGDEAEAGLRSILNPSKSYDEHLNGIRSDQAEFAQKEALANTVGEIGGSLLSPLGTAGMAVKAAKGLKALGAGEKLAGIGGNILSGVGQSAVYGSGTAEGSLEDRLKGATAGGIMGGLVGAPMAAAGRAGEFLAQKVAESPIASSVGNLLDKTSHIGQIVRAGEKALQSLPIVGGALNRVEKKSLEEGKNLISGGMGATRLDQLGNEATEALNKPLERAQNEINQAYKGADDILQNKLGVELNKGQRAEDLIPASTTRTTAKIDELMNRPGVLAPEKRALQKIKDDIDATTQHTAGSLKRSKSLMYDAMDNDKKLLDSSIKKEVYNAMKEDRYDAVRAAAGDKGEEAVNALKQGDKLHQEKIGKYEEDADLMDLADKKPAMVANKLINAFESGRKGDLDFAKKALNAMDPADADAFLKKAGIAKLLPADKDWHELKGAEIDKMFDKLSAGGQESEAQRFLFGNRVGDIGKTTDIFENIGAKDALQSGNLAAAAKIAALGGAAGIAQPLIMGGSDNQIENAKDSLGRAGVLGGGGSLIALALANPKLASKILRGVGGGSRLVPYIAGQSGKQQQGVQNNG